MKRAAYSDRSARLMAVLSEFAYTPFDEDDNRAILAVGRELADLTDRERTEERLKGLAALEVGAKFDGNFASPSNFDERSESEMLL